MVLLTATSCKDIAWEGDEEDDSVFAGNDQISFHMELAVDVLPDRQVTAFLRYLYNIHTVNKKQMETRNKIYLFSFFTEKLTHRVKSDYVK
jgi:hypothetical protein